jgi:hypothetical protein
MNSLINVCEKLKFFREIHQSGERPPYIDICKLKSDRSFLSKFRLSAHSLADMRLNEIFELTILMLTFCKNVFLKDI